MDLQMNSSRGRKPSNGALELEQLLSDRRLTPAHRRVVQALLNHESEIGYLSAIELARLADVSQPSMSRFAREIGFSGFKEMRDHFRSLSKRPQSGTVEQPKQNKYLAAITAEASNLAALASAFSNTEKLEAAATLLAKSRPLIVLGLRASMGLANHFGYYAAKIHPDVRVLTSGGSLLDDQLEQARHAGATCLLAFALPLYPQETMACIKHAADLGMKIVVVADNSFQYQRLSVDHLFTGNLHSGLVFDSWASVAVVMNILLDALCDKMPASEERLLLGNKSSIRRKVFVRN